MARVLVATTTMDLQGIHHDDDALVSALVEVGIDADLVPWTAADTDWADADAVVIRSTWDYPHRRDDYLAWADGVEASGTPLWNPAEVLRWNTHKSYLLELEERGAPIVPTAWLGRGDNVELAALAADRRWDAVVAKPAVGSGARGMLVADGADAMAAVQPDFAALVAAGDAMVQPVQRRIGELGELSIVCIDGSVSHAVRKIPAPGDLRSQGQFGSRYADEVPDDDTRRLAEWIIEATGHDLLYARVDLLPAEDGTWQLGELEVTEPYLYLDTVPGAAARLAHAIGRRLG